MCCAARDTCDVYIYAYLRMHMLPHFEKRGFSQITNIFYLNK